MIKKKDLIICGYNNEQITRIMLFNGDQKIRSVSIQNPRSKITRRKKRAPHTTAMRFAVPDSQFRRPFLR